jgi:hypothetical protein
MATQGWTGDVIPDPVWAPTPQPVLTTYPTPGGTIEMPAASLEPCGFCEWCSNGYSFTIHSGKCPKVSGIEYYPNGTVKRVWFHGEG